MTFNYQYILLLIMLPFRIRGKSFIKALITCCVFIHTHDTSSQDIFQPVNLTVDILAFAILISAAILVWRSLNGG